MYCSMGIMVIFNNHSYLIFFSDFMALNYYETEGSKGNETGPEGPQGGIIKTAQRELTF